MDEDEFSDEDQNTVSTQLSALVELFWQELLPLVILFFYKIAFIMCCFRCGWNTYIYLLFVLWAIYAWFILVLFCNQKKRNHIE